MSFIIEKKVGNNTYLYEVTSYWDSEKQQPRQKRKYLGKKDPKSGQPIRVRKEIIPRIAKDYGHIYLFQAIANQIGLARILRNIFADDYQLLLALAFFEISDASPLYLFSSWVDSTFLPEIRALSPKALTSLTKRLGRMERERLKFSREWVMHLDNVETIFFDITSLSSYSKFLEYVEWGYNRDSDKLPQINLGIIYTQSNNMPVHYQLYLGSICDVSTLTNIIKYLDLFQLKEILFILDRGFYSGENLLNMQKAQIKFIIPMPRTVKHFSVLHSRHKQNLYRPENAFILNDEVFFHSKESTNIKEVSLEAHVYFNEQNRSEQSTRFLKKILDLERTISNKTFRSKQQLCQYISNQLKGVEKFFNVEIIDNHVKITRNNEMLVEHMNEMGITIMLTNQQNLDSETLLGLYRQKDYLEKIFNILKNEFDGKRLRAQSKDAVEGRLFIKFISLIIYATITNTMRNKKLFRLYTVKEMIYELKKLKIIEIDNGEKYLTEISKKQKNIFKQFNLQIPDET